MKILLLITLIFFSFQATQSLRSPESLAKLVSDQIVQQHYSQFFEWNYGDAIILDGLYEVSATFKSLDYTADCSKTLDKWISQSGSVAWNVLNNKTMPFDAAVGDHIGLYPMTYLDRYLLQKNPTDLQIAKTVVDKYIMPWPHRLSDNTFSRTHCWSGQQENGTCVWADDMFMGMTLPSRMAAALNNREYIDAMAKMQVTYATHLQDQSDTNLFFHGFNGYTGDHSPYKWGRANGWAMMSHIEVLLGLKSFPGHPLQSQVLGIFQSHSKALKTAQSWDGRWHQVVDHKETFLETSGTSMILFSICVGVTEGWLDKSEFDSVIENAYAALESVIWGNGIVGGLCVGTGIESSLESYERRPTDYFNSSPGLGSVLRALAAYERYSAGKMDQAIAF